MTFGEWIPDKVYDRMLPRWNNKGTGTMGELANDKGRRENFDY